MPHHTLACSTPESPQDTSPESSPGSPAEDVVESPMDYTTAQPPENTTVVPYLHISRQTMSIEAWRTAIRSHRRASWGPESKSLSRPSQTLEQDPFMRAYMDLKLAMFRRSVT